MSQLDDQFDVLSNTLRKLPEEILRLNYFIREIYEPEEGISNVETACVNVFNSIYGMMCVLKDSGAIDSIYEDNAITTVLCIRHVLQHKTSRIKNNLRDAFNRSIDGKALLVKYNDSELGTFAPLLYINAAWLQDEIADSNNAKRLASINTFWCLDRIKHQVETRVDGKWSNTYICAMSLITEAVRSIVVKYGGFFSPAGFDSGVYYDHFKKVGRINPSDYGIIN
jgi:hypothetical protein